MNMVERNNRLYDLRNKLAWAKTEVMALEAEIQSVRREYENQDLDLYSEMFPGGETAMADEVYGG